MRFDFIMCCDCIEHCSSPDYIINVLKKHLAENGLLYIEVPFDTPFYRKPMYYVDLLLNKNFSIKHKIARGLDMIKCPYSMGEHVNFFTPKSIKIFLNKAGFDIVRIEEYIAKNSGFVNYDIISVLAKLK